MDEKPEEVENEDADRAEAEEVKKEEPEKKKKRKKGCTNDEVLAVLSHELGHWYLNHVLKQLVLSQVSAYQLEVMQLFNLFFSNDGKL